MVGQLKDDDRQHLGTELGARTWAELETFEDDAGRIYFPDRLLRRARDGSFVPVELSIRVPREPELRHARIVARRIAAEDGLDSDRDPDRFDNLDTICILHQSLFDPPPSRSPFAMDERDLEKRLDPALVEQAWAKVEYYRRVIDPRPDEVTDAELLATIAAIAKERGIRPLHALDLRSQSSCIVTMAAALQSFLEPSSSSERLERLTQARSASRD
jgi:hypothetical protein